MGQFSGAWGIATGSGSAAGTVFVADQANNRIDVFNTNGIPITYFGNPGSGSGSFSGPYGVAADSSGNVYVADQGNNLIQKFTYNGAGNYGFTSQWGGGGNGNGQFAGIYDVAVDPTGNTVYAVDMGDNGGRIQAFSSIGGFEATANNSLTSGLFSNPMGVAVGPNYVYVADEGHNLIKRFDYHLDVSGSAFISWGGGGSGNGKFGSPHSLATDSSGNVYVSDSGNTRIQVFDANGNYLCQVSDAASTFTGDSLWNCSRSLLRFFYYLC